MRIESADVVVTSPGRNFVTLKLTTSDGVVGLGDATVNGRELAVASYLRDHVAALLVGREANNIEDTWQYLYRGAYWRRGPVTMAAIAAVDMALWDIKAKVAGMPLYQLLGGRSRRGALAYGHSSGSTVESLLTSIRNHLDQGFKAIRIQTGVPGLGKVYGVATDQTAGQRYDYEPAGRTAVPVEELMDFAAMYQIKSGFHGPTDVSPVGMAAALHLDVSLHNFGIQEYMVHSVETLEVFRTSYTFTDGLLDPGETPGLGVHLDETAAAAFPYTPAYRPVNRLLDGTMHDW